MNPLSKRQGGVLCSGKFVGLPEQVKVCQTRGNFGPSFTVAQNSLANFFLGFSEEFWMDLQNAIQAIAKVSDPNLVQKNRQIAGWEQSALSY